MGHHGSCSVNESITIGADVIALAKEPQTVTTRATAEGILQHTGKRTHVVGVDIAGVGGLVAARDGGIVAALGLGLGHRVLVVHGVLDIAVTGGGSTLARLGKSHSGSDEEDGRGKELHFDGWILGRNRRIEQKEVEKVFEIFVWIAEENELEDEER